MQEEGQVIPLERAREKQFQLNALKILFMGKNKDISDDVLRRNKLWIPRLLQYFNQYNDKPIVVVVGSIHFIGPEGILKLLQDQGYIFKVMAR